MRPCSPRLDTTMTMGGGDLHTTNALAGAPGRNPVIAVGRFKRGLSTGNAGSGSPGAPSPIAHAGAEEKASMSPLINASFQSSLGGSDIQLPPSLLEAFGDGSEHDEYKHNEKPGPGWLRFSVKNQGKRGWLKQKCCGKSPHKQELLFWGEENGRWLNERCRASIRYVYQITWDNTYKV